MIFKFTEVKKWQTKHSLITCRRALMQWERNRREDSEMKSYQYWFGFCKQKIVVHCFLTHSVFVASPRITLSDKCRHPRVHNLNDFIQTYLSFIVDFSLVVARFLSVCLWAIQWGSADIDGQSFENCSSILLTTLSPYPTETLVIINFSS